MQNEKFGVCMVYEGNTTPGHSSKNSLLDREFTKLNTSHKDMCIGELFTLMPPSARDLTYKESKSLKCSMEHDRILFNGSDRQHASLNCSHIGEFDFLRLGSPLWQYNDWRITIAMHECSLFRGSCG